MGYGGSKVKNIVWDRPSPARSVFDYLILVIYLLPVSGPFFARMFQLRVRVRVRVSTLTLTRITLRRIGRLL